ncbi:MAG TPA: filamentous hemagglutinin N-terminal domain-containing protein [Waterburya sp.]|jgi:filamentous hemagglutinin family protein
MQGWERSHISKTLPVAGSIALCLFSLLTPADAQIIPDGTLGAERSVVTPNLNNPIPSDQIDGGAIRGTNLFHSFREFNVGEGRGAYFTNPTGIANIFSRVTGTNPSNILGTLGVLGNANLFLINPNGIIFGFNARLDVAGSFLASTASSFLFDNNLEFTATNPQAPPLLTINRPIGLNYRTQQPAALVNAGKLAVPPGQNLTLSGGTVAITGQLSAPGGQLSVVAVPGVSFVQLGQTGQVVNLSPTSNLPTTTAVPSTLPTLLNTLGYETGIRAMGDHQVELIASGTQIPSDVGTVIVSGMLDASNSVVGKTGGTIQVFGNQVGLFDSTRINASGAAGGGTVLIGGNYGGQGILPQATATYVGRDVTINADAPQAGNGGQIVVWANDSTQAYGSLSAHGGGVAGNGGLIETSSHNFLDVSGIEVNTTAANGVSGTWLIDPRNVIIQNVRTTNGTFSGTNPNVFTPTGDNAVVRPQDIQAQLNAGTNVTITTGNIGNQEGNITVVDSITKATGGSATLTLEAANNITFNRGVRIRSNSNALNLVLTADSDRSGAGDVVLSDARIRANGGQVNISANSLLETNSDISSTQSNGGDAGAINVKAKFISLQRSGFGSNASGSGNAGQITLQANTITFEDFSGLGAHSEGSGNAGQITVTADSLLLKKSAFDTNAYGDGNAGKINVTADSIIFTEASAFASGPSGKGNGGQVNVNANSILMTGNGGISTQTEGSGDGGQINVTAHSIVLQGTGFSSQTSSTGNGGQINLTADSILLEGDLFGISTDSSGSGRGGDVTLRARELIVRDGSKIAVNSSGSGSAGNLSVIADSIFLDTDANLTASTVSGQGGNINLTAQTIQLNRGSSITVSSTGQGRAGNLQLQADSIHLDNQAAIRANTTGGQGNINLNAVDLVMRHGSEITTIASGQDRVGGNININTAVLVALENSDIAADSADFRGGNVNVSTQGIFGTAFRPQRTSESDITASGANSSLSGTVTIYRFGVDPSQGLTNLPTEVVDASRQIAQTCSTAGGSFTQNQFIITGRGGSPENPKDILASEAVVVEWATSEPQQQGSNGQRTRANSQLTNIEPESSKGQLVEAQGWIMGADGQVILTASSPTVTPHMSGLISPNCLLKR